MLQCSPGAEPSQEAVNLCRTLFSNCYGFFSGASKGTQQYIKKKNKASFKTRFKGSYCHYSEPFLTRFYTEPKKRRKCLRFKISLDLSGFLASTKRSTRKCCSWGSSTQSPETDHSKGQHQRTNCSKFFYGSLKVH